MQTKILTKRVPFTFNRRGYYYFTRRVPKDLLHHYLCSRIVQGLMTRSPSVARTSAMIAAAKLDEYWSHLRMTDPELFGKHMLKLPNQKLSSNVSEKSLSIYDALKLYRTTKGESKSKTFHQASERACRYLVESSGAKDLHEYSRADALSFRDYLLAKDLAGSSITRVFNTLTSVVNFAISENALNLKNPFTRVYHNRTAGVSKRLPIPTDTIGVIQVECISIDDDMRWLIALLSDTGMRLGEAAGLAKADIVVDSVVPHIIVQPHSWRSLKTLSSTRKIPLVGASLWAAKRIMNSNPNCSFAFPRYNKTDLTNANSASAALNKWLKGYVLKGCTVHSFRHSMRDRLRAVECPSDIIDQIGGWAKEGVGQGYGEGYSLEQLMWWVNKMSKVYLFTKVP